MLQSTVKKYDAFPAFNLPNRKWPSRTLERPPRWLSTDLRDGNQALVQPMDSSAKLRYFRHLLDLGYKEIEISYPSASRTEFDFTRQLIMAKVIPEDVWIQVMSPCREELIRTTIEAARGASKVIVHIHLSTSACFRDVVFNMTERETVDLAVRCSKLIRTLTKDSEDPELRKTEWTLEFTPENFQDTSIEFAVRICEAVKAAWEPTQANQIIFNLAATVEVAMPNVFADQVEIFCGAVSEREKICVSLHNHNDRGCAVAATEMGLLAGADRVEGCLFGNGERTGNVDLVTLALNLFTNGVYPEIEFNKINQVVDMVEELTKIPIHMRAPYAGKYTFCTFSGTHQDAIRKGYKSMGQQRDELGGLTKWRMPYLPMDPDDLGRRHEAVIRLNSQSGKSGIGWYVNEVFEVDMPKALEVAFTKVVKHYANDNSAEITHNLIEKMFRSNYMLGNPGGIQLLDCALITDKSRAATLFDGDGESGLAPNGTDVWSQTNGFMRVKATFRLEGVRHEVSGSGYDLMTSVASAVRGLGYNFETLDHKTERQQNCDGAVKGINSTERVTAFVHLATDGKACWGVGIHKDPVWASLTATLSAAEKLSKVNNELSVAETTLLKGLDDVARI